MSQYKGRLGGELMEDGKTCVDIEKKPIEQVVEEIKCLNQPDNYAKISNNVYQAFCDRVSFDREAEAITDFLEKLR